MTWKTEGARSTETPETATPAHVRLLPGFTVTLYQSDSLKGLLSFLCELTDKCPYLLVDALSWAQYSYFINFYYRLSFQNIVDKICPHPQALKGFEAKSTQVPPNWKSL